MIPTLSSSEIVALRPAVDRPAPSPELLGSSVELEFAGRANPLSKRLQDVQLANVLTLFLRGSECAFRCVMCDLWKWTHSEATRSGQISEQVEAGVQAYRNSHPAASSTFDTTITEPNGSENWIKLYNASNFFASRNVPTEDLQSIAESVSDFQRVIVENHPKVLNEAICSFRDALNGRLEIAMGLETIHPEVLPRLNKSMDLKDFAHACEWLHNRDVDVRAFVLLRPPGLSEQEGVDWCLRSVDFASELGIRHISIIPVRSGNGAIEHLAARGHFTAPQASSLETVLVESLQLERSVVTVDLWDWDDMLGHCDQCRQKRKLRLQNANLYQVMPKQSDLTCSCNAF